MGDRKEVGEGRYRASYLLWSFRDLLAAAGEGADADDQQPLQGLAHGRRLARSIITEGTKGNEARSLQTLGSGGVIGGVGRGRTCHGVKWHDGRPFTAKDVECTWDLLTGRGNDKLRINPRKSWYDNLDAVTASGDFEVTFRLKRPQPSFLTLLASGWSPVYPCHVPARDMRNHPIGTGPFKFVEFKPNVSITLARNLDYWKPA